MVDSTIFFVRLFVVGEVNFVLFFDFRFHFNFSDVVLIFGVATEGRRFFLGLLGGA